MTQNEAVMLDGYSAWLIELKGNSVSYYQQVDDDNWTPDHDKALHFCRKSDAEQVMKYYGWTEAFASEHRWNDKRTTPPQADQSAAQNDHAKALEALDKIMEYNSHLYSVHPIWFDTVKAAITVAPVDVETLKRETKKAIRAYDNLEETLLYCSYVDRTIDYLAKRNLITGPDKFKLPAKIIHMKRDPVGRHLTEITVHNDETGNNEIFTAPTAEVSGDAISGELITPTNDPAQWIKNCFQGKGYGPFTDMTHIANCAADEIFRLRKLLEVK